MDDLNGNTPHSSQLRLYMVMEDYRPVTFDQRVDLVRTFQSAPPRTTSAACLSVVSGSHIATRLGLQPAMPYRIQQGREGPLLSGVLRASTHRQGPNLWRSAPRGDTATCLELQEVHVQRQATSAGHSKNRRRLGAFAIWQTAIDPPRGGRLGGVTPSHLNGAHFF